jgi:hypothetical protein
MSFSAAYASSISSSSELLTRLDDLRYTEDTDELIQYLRLLVCLLNRGVDAEPSEPMKFNVRSVQGMALQTSDPRIELASEALEVAKKQQLDTCQSERVIGVLLWLLEHNPPADYKVTLRQAYERCRANCLWMQVKSIVDGKANMNPDVVAWSYMVRAAMELPKVYTVCVSAMVAHSTGNWDFAARLWKKARDKYKHTLTSAQTDFLERYDAKMYTVSTQAQQQKSHFAIDPLTHPNNMLFRFGQDPLQEEADAK